MQNIEQLIESKFNERWSQFLSNSAKRIDSKINTIKKTVLEWEPFTELYISLKEAYTDLEHDHYNGPNLYFICSELAKDTTGIYIKTNEIGDLKDIEYVFIPFTNLIGYQLFKEVIE